MILPIRLLFALVGALALGQAPSVTFSPRFAEFREVTATAEVSTLQLAQASSRRMFPLSLYVWCEQSCTVTIETAGTAASATLSNAVASIGLPTTAAGAIYLDSNVGAGTVLNKVRISGGTGQTVGLTEVFFGAGGPAARNLTWRIAGDSSGVIRRSILWAEQ